MIVEGVGQQRLVSVEAKDGNAPSVVLQVLRRSLDATTIDDPVGPWIPEATITLDVNHAEALETAIRAARLEAEARSRSLP